MSKLDLRKFEVKQIEGEISCTCRFFSVIAMVTYAAGDSRLHVRLDESGVPG